MVNIDSSPVQTSSQWIQCCRYLFILITATSSPASANYQAKLNRCCQRFRRGEPILTQLQGGSDLQIVTGGGRTGPTSRSNHPVELWGCREREILFCEKRSILCQGYHWSVTALMSHLLCCIIVLLPMWSVTTVLSFSFDLLQLSSFIMLGPYVQTGKWKSSWGREKHNRGGPDRSELINVMQNYFSL